MIDDCATYGKYFAKIGCFLISEKVILFLASTSKICLKRFSISAVQLSMIFFLPFLTEAV